MRGCLEIILTIFGGIIKWGGCLLLLGLPLALLLAFTGGTIFEPFPGQGLPPHGNEIASQDYWCCMSTVIMFLVVTAFAALRMGWR